MHEVVVIDFETTGLSPDYGRIIEVGAVVTNGQEITGSFSQLMHPGCRIPSEITMITGITNSMVKEMPPPEMVMPKLKKFIGGRVILAHNAAFDRKFLLAEMQRAHLTITNPMLCTMLLARRLVTGVPNYQLTTLAKHFRIKSQRAHRALDDATTTAQLWNFLHQKVAEHTGIFPLDQSIFAQICAKPKNAVNGYLAKLKNAPTDCSLRH